MLICKVDDEMELHLLERKFAKALESLDPGDLTFNQGEWIGTQGNADQWLTMALADFAAGTRLEAGIIKNKALIGIVALHNINLKRYSADLDYALDGKYSELPGAGKTGISKGGDCA